MESREKGNTFNAVVTVVATRIRFDGRSTAYQTFKSHSDVTWAADQLTAATLTYLFIYLDLMQPRQTHRS